LGLFVQEEGPEGGKQDMTIERKHEGCGAELYEAECARTNSQLKIAILVMLALLGLAIHLAMQVLS